MTQTVPRPKHQPSICMLEPGDTSGRLTLELCVNATGGDLQASDSSCKTIFVSFLRKGQDESEEIIINCHSEALASGKISTKQPSLLLETYPSASFKYSRLHSASFTLRHSTYVTRSLFSFPIQAPEHDRRHLNAGYILRRKPRPV